MEMSLLCGISRQDDGSFNLQSEKSEFAMSVQRSLSVCSCSRFSRAPVWRTMLFVAVLTLMARPLLRADCSLTSTGIIPLNDLGPGSYDGFTAGLYPAGSNMPPAAHAAAALAIANN